MNIEGKTVLVTGAAGGLGSATARVFHDAGNSAAAMIFERV